MNVTRWALYERLKATGLPVAVGTGGRTKFNRTRQGYDKTHWIDAACVGVSGEQVYIASSHRPLSIQAVGRQNRQMTLVNKYGFPRTKGKAARFSHGFQSGDIVEACVPSGKRTGHYRGKVAIKASGSFTVAGTPDISWKHCHLIQRADGYSYTYPAQKGARNSPVA